MMRRSGSSPAVKRWKLCCEMLRRAASGHIEATQFSKFAAASRIARAVISGWPEAPSSPLQGGAGLLAAGAACACAEVPGRCGDGAIGLPFENQPVKTVSKKLKGPPLDACAHASPDISCAASMAAAVRLLAHCFVRRVMSHSALLKAYPRFRGPRRGFQQLNKGEILVLVSCPPATGPGTGLHALEFLYASRSLA